MKSGSFLFPIRLEEIFLFAEQENDEIDPHDDDEKDQQFRHLTESANQTERQDGRANRVVAQVEAMRTKATEAKGQEARGQL